MKKIVLLLIISFQILQSYCQTEFEFKHYNQASHPQLGGNNFKTVGVGKNGHIWAGSQYHGLVKFNPADSSWQAASTLTNVFITDIETDQNGNIWVTNAGTAGGGTATNLGGGISVFPGDNLTQTNFYTIGSPGGLTSRNARSVWIDKHHDTGSTPILWVAQGTYISSSVTQAGGFSVGLNNTPNYFTKGYIGLQVTPYVTSSNAGTPNCTAVGGFEDEVWICARQNFGRTQILRYRADSGPNAFLGAYDNTNTAVLTTGFIANAIYFDAQDRGWIGLQSGGVIVKQGTIWKTINLPTIFPSGTIVNPNAITSDQLGNVYIGTSNGLVIFRGGSLDSASSYRRVTTADGLPTDNINGIAVDTFRNRIILAHSSGISFMKYRTKFHASLEWDHSFPKPDIKPFGVIADGMSRLLIKIRRMDTTLRKIKEVQLSIIKNLNVKTAFAGNLLGKLKKALVYDQYSNEANTGTSQEVNRTDSTPAGDFWFWYVAPDDFSVDSLSNESQKSERIDSIKVKITYEDNSTDSSYIGVKVHRPPLMLGSMLSKTFKSILAPILNDSIPLLMSNLFTEKMGLLGGPLGKISDVAKNMLEGASSIAQGLTSHSIQGLLNDVRKRGIAGTRIDFVGHGLLGNIGRLIPQLFRDKFFADGGALFNNYNKGFFNKFISIATPHNGSVIADLFKHVSGLNGIVKKLLSKSMFTPFADMFPYKIFNNNDSLLTGMSGLFGAIGSQGDAIRHATTQVKNHLIVANAEIDPDAPRVPTRRSGMFGIGGIASSILRDIFPMSHKLMMTSFFDSLTPLVNRLLKGLNIFANLKGFTDFTKNSDLFSHTLSQSAGQPLTSPFITLLKSPVVDMVLHEGVMNISGIGKKILNLLNSSIQSPVFSDAIPANNTAVPPPLEFKPSQAYYDTNKIVTDDRQLNGLRVFNNDTTVTLKFRVKDTVGLQYIFVDFQDTMYTTLSKARNQQIVLKVKRLMAYSGLQQISAVGVYETADSIKYHADTINTYITPPDSLQGFRVTEEHVELYDGNPYYPNYEVNIAGEWQPLRSGDTAIKISVQIPTLLTYDASRLAFDAIGKGLTRAYFTYKQYRDTVLLDCQPPLRLVAINRSIASGNFSNPTIWSKGRAPLQDDSVIISTGHSVTLNSTSQIRSLRIDNGGTLVLNQNLQLSLGTTSDGDFMVDNYGTLNISSGTLMVNGRVKLNPGCTFNMTGGNLIIDGNTGHTITSLQDGAYLFEAAPGMSSFSFTGGTLQIIDPPIGVSSQALNCPYSFGVNSTLILGNGVSQTASSNPNGFGGSLFPPLLGTLILDAGTPGNNRQLTITKPLSVQGTFRVKTGSNLILKAPVNVTQ